MTRRVTVALACAFVTALIAFDLATAEVRPYAAPRLFALGSGSAPVGGFCGAPVSSGS